MLSAVVTGYILRRRYGKEDLGNWIVSPDRRTGTAAPQGISRRYSKQKFHKKRKE